MTEITKSEVVLEKIEYYRSIIINTILSIQQYKQMNVIGANELNLAITNLESNNELLSNLKTSLEKDSVIKEEHINVLQEINDNLSVICKNYGTHSIDDILCICFGKSFLNKWIQLINRDKYELLQKYFHPTGYKLVNCTKKRVVCPIEKNKIVDESKMEEFGDDLDCFDLARTNKIFSVRLAGLKLLIFNNVTKIMLILSGIMDDVFVDCLNNTFVSTIRKEVTALIENDNTEPYYYEFIKTITLKEWLVYSSGEIMHKFKGYESQMKLIQQKSMSQLINDFMNKDLYSQRTLLIIMLCRMECNQFKYISYLLYDLLSNDVNGTIDTTEQRLLYDSLPWFVKKNFKIAMTETIDYTNNLIKFEQNKIPLEQQICLLKTTDAIKEKAMSKLREIKAKSEDSGSKSRQYLDGLLRIPFGIYREEEILTLMKTIKTETTQLLTYSNELAITSIDVTSNLNSLQINNILETINDQSTITIIVNKLQHFIKKAKRSTLVQIITSINQFIKTFGINDNKLCHSGLKITTIRSQLVNFIETYQLKIDVNEWIKLLYNTQHDTYLNLQSYITSIQEKQNTITNYITNVKETLDMSVYGHNDAKRQIERIIGQWINGEMSGYCFGFEGPPGVGKTSLALNGIAKCLTDSDDTHRPFLS